MCAGLLDISSRARNTLCVLSTLTLGTCLAMAGRVTLGTCYSFFIFAFSFAFSLGNLANTSGDLARAAGAAARALAAMRQAGGELPMQNAEGAADGAAASSTGAAQLGAAAAGQGSSSGSGTLREIPADQVGGFLLLLDKRLLLLQAPSSLLQKPRICPFHRPRPLKTLSVTFWARLSPW